MDATKQGPLWAFVLHALAAVVGLAGAGLALREGHNLEALFWAAILVSSGVAAAHNRGWATRS